MRDALGHLGRVLAIEMNAATDNPLIFPDVVVADADARATGHGHVISGGNFHGEPVALALDFAKLALAELGSISERRIALLLDANLNGGLPAFLASDSGLETGYMLLQYTAAALASENKVLAHPASADSIPTSANQEDHVSMGPIAGRMARHGPAPRRADRRDRAAVRGARARPPAGAAPRDRAGRGRRRGARGSPRGGAAVGRRSRARRRPRGGDHARPRWRPCRVGNPEMSGGELGIRVHRPYSIPALMADADRADGRIDPRRGPPRCARGAVLGRQTRRDTGPVHLHRHSARPRRRVQPPTVGPEVTFRIFDVTDEAGFAADPAVRRPGLRPSDVRLLGGRPPRVEGRAPVVARARASARRPSRSGRSTRSRRRRGAGGQPVRPAGGPGGPRNVFDPFAERRRAHRQPVRARGASAGRPSRPTRRARSSCSPAGWPCSGATRRSSRRMASRPRTASSVRSRRTRGRSGCATSTRSSRARRCRRSSRASRRHRQPRSRGLAKTLVLAVVEDLAGRGFSAVEAYPEPETDPDATSAANPAFWAACGFELAIDDPRFPVVRKEL